MANLPFLLLAAGIVLFATYPVDITAASDCHFTPSAEVPEACPSNHTEVYKTETHSKYKRYCCKKGTKSEKDNLKSNHECRHTDCTTVKGDICQTLLPQHYVDDQQILLEETIRDDCVQKNGEPAAHCVEKENAGNIKVLYGVKDLSKTGGKETKVEKEVGVSSVKIANGFSKVSGNKLRRKRMVDVTIPKDQEGRVSMKGGYYKNDLALLKLDEKIDGNVAKLPAKGSKIPGSATEVAYTNDTTRAWLIAPLLHFLEGIT
ncbi:unnamed protein product [Orchesella dallaii]|uniref:Uncharacterized protein n=1 Tax=Orchesella dallaii TaxID=48710 RepID=A0ABP1RBL3_9HEXA